MDVTAGFRWYGSGRGDGGGARWGCTWRVFVALYLPKLFLDQVLLPDSNVGGHAIVDDFGDLVLVGGLQ
jgi:hypothetical protein